MGTAPVWLSCLGICLLTGLSRANVNAPRFIQGSSITTIPEDTAVGTVIFGEITVQDDDMDNPYLDVSCAKQDLSYNACDIFELVPSVVPTTMEFRGQIILRRPVDFEAFSVYLVTLAAYDSVSTHYQTYTINVINVQDVGPVFLESSLSGSIPEDAALGTPVVQVTATDGDKFGASIRYTLLEDTSQNFAMDSDSGLITTAGKLDREKIVDGRVMLKVLASEVHPNGSLGSGSTANVSITITDVNDNLPVFSPEVQEITLQENVVNGSAIPSLNIRVVDYDQGANAAFRIRLLNHTDIFDVQPTEGRQSLAATIIVINSNKIDFDFGVRQYRLTLVAEEISLTGRQSTGQVIINIDDANDFKPVFERPFYTASVPETAMQPYEVITVLATDLDSSTFFGTPSIRYKLTALDGSRVSQFSIGRSGIVTVARPAGCFDAGVASCLDADIHNLYSLLVVATDSFAEGFSTVVQLNITIEDVNDNRPKMTVPDYQSRINETSTVVNPPVYVKATDGDRPDGLYSTIRYKIVGGQSNPILWQIDPVTGFVNATRGVPYPPSGRYTFTVEATDNFGLSDVGSVTILVDDINNYSPVFTQNGYYEVSIPEDTLSNTVVEEVKASDNDPQNSPNGNILYRIIEGDQGKFVLNETSGVLRVAPGVGPVFDFDQQNRYNITVIAEDQGSPKRSATAFVVVHILDANNKNPVLRPTTTRGEVYENAQVGTSVATVYATDPDNNARLEYTLIGPFKAWDPQNKEITGDPEIQRWFALDPATGLFTVNGKLDRDRVIRWSAVVQVQDKNGINQTATGLIVVNIVEVNERPPEFAQPWTSLNPFIPLNRTEGQDSGTYVTTIVATDSSGGIDKYMLISNPSQHFNLNEKTGVVTINNPLDYEQEKLVQFVVVAVDNGQPQRSATATVVIDVINVNDESPAFTSNQYESSIPENSPEGTRVIQVEAKDKDSGNYGVVRYQLVEQSSNFIIDPVNGWITVGPGANLDREKQRLHVITVQAYDSPNDQAVRRTVSSKVYITLMDVDEFTPTFSSSRYNVFIPETRPADSSVIQLTASDEDDSPPSFFFQKISGDPNDLFQVDPNTGLVTTKKSMEDHPGVYNVTVQVSNRNGNVGKVNFTVVEISVLEMDNRPPIWLFPNTTVQTVEMFEDQPAGTEVVTVRAADTNAGIYGMFDYSFNVDGEMVALTEDFQINTTTGRIIALRPFDREVKDVYVLSLVARDRGIPFQEAKQTLVVHILDINDNRPEFPMHRNCCTVSHTLNISETAPPNSLVTTITAKDLDTGINAKIYYSFVSGNELGDFVINRDTGEIKMNSTVDHERISYYSLVIQASNENQSSVAPVVPPNGQCAAACTNPSLVSLYINILDVNEFSPVFPASTYNACVAATAGFNTVVTQLSAVDKDKNSSMGVTYKIDSLELIPIAGRQYANDSFLIDSKTGKITTNALMEIYTKPERYFKLKIRASDIEKSTQAVLRIFVTDSDKEVVITLAETKKMVEANLDEEIRKISELTGWGIVCINSIRVHVDGDGVVHVDQTDLYLHVIDPNSLSIIDPEIVRNKLKFISGGIVLASASQWTGFIRDPVLIAIIIIAILIGLALLLLLCFCCCWSALIKKQQKYVEAPIVLNAGTVNPVWKGYEVQELSMAVQDQEKNKLRAMSGFFNAGYDYTDTHRSGISNGYLAHEEVHVSERDNQMTTTHIEADLLRATGSRTNMSGSALGMGSGYGASTMTRAVQTDDQGSALNVSTEYLGPGSPARIGATLTPSMWTLNGYDHVMDNEAFMTHDGRSVGMQTFRNIRNTYDYRHEDGYMSYAGGGGGGGSRIMIDTDSDYPDSFYQGEIHLGTLPSQSSHYQTQTTQYSEYLNSNDNDGEIEYVTF